MLHNNLKRYAIYMDIRFVIACFVNMRLQYFNIIVIFIFKMFASAPLTNSSHFFVYHDVCVYCVKLNMTFVIKPQGFYIMTVNLILKCIYFAYHLVKNTITKLCSRKYA